MVSNITFVNITASLNGKIYTYREAVRLAEVDANFPKFNFLMKV